jgi:hypothetical protein
MNKQSPLSDTQEITFSSLHNSLNMRCIATPLIDYTARDVDNSGRRSESGAVDRPILLPPPRQVGCSLESEAYDASDSPDVSQLPQSHAHLC